MPYATPEREPRNYRLLRLMLLQIAILSIANGCTGNRQAMPVEHTATSRLDTGRLVVETEP